MSSEFSLDAGEVDEIARHIAEFPGDAESAINEVMHQEAGPIIYRQINPLIHPSGRTFAGHRSSATASDWPRYVTSENLAVTVSTKRKFDYLYFPDDGSTTRRHAGNQRFFERGGSAAAPEIVERCLAKLDEDWS